MLHLLQHKELGLRLCISSVVGEISRLRWEAVSKKEWAYVEEFLECTVFDSFHDAVSCRDNFRLPSWIVPRELTDLECDLLNVNKTPKML